MALRIVYFLRDITDCGGIQQVTSMIVNSLIKSEDYDISIVSLYHKNQTPFFEIDSRIGYYKLFDHPINPRTGILKIIKQLENKIKKDKPELMIIQGAEFSTYVSSYIWKNVKVIVCEHGYFNMGRPLGLHWIGRNRALKRARAIITLTFLDAENYKKASKRNILIKYIYNPCLNESKTCSGFDLSAKTIVSCGRMDSVKRFEHAIEAARIVISKHPDWQWFIYGNGSNWNDLQQMVSDYKLQNNVFLKGYEKDKDVIYGNKSIFVLTSKFEGFGMVLIEAMQHHLPVVSYDVNYGPKEIIDDSMNGCLVPDGNIEELAKTIGKLIEDVDTRKKISENAYNGLDKFSLEKITDQWIKLFESI